MWVVSGRLVESIGSRQYPCSVTDVMWKQAGLDHASCLEGSASRVVLLELLPSLLDTMSEEGTLPPGGSTLVSGTPAALFARLLPLIGSAGPGDALAVQELVAEVVSAMSAWTAEPSDVSGWLATVRERLHEEPWAAISLGSLARDAGVHPAYLSRVFRQRFGRSMTEYMHARRIDLAVMALAEGEEDIGRLGVSLGYYDHAHFSRTFKRTIGIPPSRFRAIVEDRTNH